MWTIALHNLISLLKSRFSVSKQKYFFGVGHSTTISHSKSRLFFFTITLQQDTNFMEMEKAYRLSQQRAEIAWQQQRKGEKISERNIITDIKLHTAMFTLENENVGLTFLYKQSLHAFCFLPNFKLNYKKHPQWKLTSIKFGKWRLYSQKSPSKIHKAGFFFFSHILKESDEPTYLHLISSPSFLKSNLLLFLRNGNGREKKKNTFWKLHSFQRSKLRFFFPPSYH